jgi:TonB family protein
MNTAAIRSDWVGRVIDGRFTLLQWLGGSEGSGVFLTELLGDRTHKAAIKLIPAAALDPEAGLAGWAATATLSHPHLMHLFHAGRCQIDDDPLLYAVTEYAEEDLSQILPERPLTPTETREMLDPVLDALSYLHGRGFVHGRLRPSNIMVVENQLKLSGDSIEVAGKYGKHLTALSVYDAPERATEVLLPATDIWSLGITLVEALTQHPPVWDRSTSREPVVPESIPQPFSEIAQECLRSAPLRRCTLSDVKARLEPARFLAVPASKPRRTVPAKLLVTVLVAAALVVFAVIAALQLRTRHNRPSLPAEEQQPVPAIATLPAQPSGQGAPTSKGVVMKGAVAERVLPDVLASASKSIHGKVNVRVRVTVDPGGNVSSATLDSPGPSKYFAKVALQAGQHWRFKPAQVDGQVVSSVWILQFMFTQTATEVSPTELSP